MKPALLLLPVLMLAACSRPATQGETESAADPTPAAPMPSDPARDDTAPATPPAMGPDTPVASPGTPDTGASLARTDGYGDLRFGMDEAKVRAAWTGELKGDVVEPDNCAYLRPKADEAFRVGFMFERGVFVRYDVNIDSETAPGGGRVGQMRPDVERLYAGRVQVQPHEYVQGGHYLRVTDPAIRDGALLFETDENGRVTRWRVGRAPQVDYVEGCA